MKNFPILIAFIILATFLSSCGIQSIPKSKNEVEAAKAAEKIKLVLQEHNKKFKDKIEFGIGINSGKIINKIEDKTLKFTALGNLISGAKRIADSSNEQVLVTKEAYERGINEIKAEKKNPIIPKNIVIFSIFLLYVA